MKNKKGDVIIVGTGIVGLMTAYYLNESGYKVTCYDFGPDPTNLHYDERMASTTYRSGNARHVTSTETSSLASSSRKGLIYKSPSVGGWMSKNIKQLTPSEKKWVDDFEYFTHHPEIIDRYNDDICRINNMGKKGWYDLIRKNKKIFENCGLQLGVGIFFLNRKHFMKEKVDSFERAKSEADFEDLYNTPKVKRLNIGKVRKAYPAFEYACDQDLLVGGLTEDCITVNAIDFCTNTINYLRNKGVAFHWEKFIVEIKRNENSEISHLVNSKGEILKANHYVFSTGWLTHGLYKDTKCEDKIMGVLGCWVTVPNPGLEAETLVAHAFDAKPYSPKCFSGAFKIDAPEPTNYINATLEGSKLIVSGGYGFIGNDITNIPNLIWPGVKAQFNHFEEIVKKIFPKAYEEAELAGSLDRRMCARPVTACGLGVFEELKTVKGGKTVIVGANAAGGFTQAPALAEAVVSSIKGKTDHFVIRAYNPSRLERSS
ncbi:FAD-binding oxidoreductase [Candidatus Gottesmanbacteria bacterium]|nr:FAD-binding oxidoreductase [Candidatus Gottesmanbacteria bacterium]